MDVLQFLMGALQHEALDLKVLPRVLSKRPDVGIRLWRLTISVMHELYHHLVRTARLGKRPGIAAEERRAYEFGYRVAHHVMLAHVKDQGAYEEWETVADAHDRWRRGRTLSTAQR